jgi:hypothetical protein
MPRKPRGSESVPKPPTQGLFETNAHDPDSSSSPAFPTQMPKGLFQQNVTS